MCHLLWGDVCGYVWGKTESRIEIPIKNEKQKQTYYGVGNEPESIPADEPDAFRAINYRTGKVIIKSYPQGNTENTIQFVKYLIQQNPSSKLIIIGDGATDHHSQEFREYLNQLNQGDLKEEWLIRCIKLAQRCT